LTQRRHRSAEVALWAVPLLAAAVTGCGGSSSAYCVDPRNNVVDNRYCDTYSPNYFWYYGGHGSNIHVGQHLAGGTRVVSSNISENIKRGGFGSSGHSSTGVGRSVSHSSGG
jgi:hypothetical protein